MLCKARHFVPPDELRSIYFSIFSSHMVYGCQVWGQNINVHIEKIQKLQNRAMRIISFSNYQADSNPIYKIKKILKLKDYISLQNCLFVHDYTNKNLPLCFNDYFQFVNEVHSKRTKNSELGCIFVPHFTTIKYGINSITRRSIDSWNFFSKKFNCKLKDITRSVLRKNITEYFIDLY